MTRTWAMVLLAASSLALATTALATVMVEVPLDEMIQRADVIVRGTVVASRARLVMREGALEPQTFTTIRVAEWLAGVGGDRVELRELGGTWQGGGLRYDGTPEYAVGEEVVVFLERRPEAPHDLRTFAMVQGKFTVRPGVPGVPDSVSRDLSGVAFARWADGQQTVRAAPAEPAMALETFLDHVRRVRGQR
jgi:hypothetical protein